MLGTRRTSEISFLLLLIGAGASLVFIGVAGIYKMHSPQAIARSRANELPPETKPRTPGFGNTVHRPCREAARYKSKQPRPRPE